MRRLLTGCVTTLAFCALLSTSVFASGHNPADYPLRVHIYEHNSHSHYYNRILDWVDGEGRANLFENATPLAFDYSYRCTDRLRNSPGFETYMARWKKRDQTLEILLPRLGTPSATVSCELKVEMKDFAYYRRDNVLETETPAAFKEWMEKHQYDPEHGKTVPIDLGPARPAADPKPTQ